MSGPLVGLTVLEMAAIGPVPLAGQLMADLGAAVIVIDKNSQHVPSDDINRRNKKSIALNLKSNQGRDIFLKLVARADGLIEGFRPGVMEKLGIGPADCEIINPKLVYGRMTGWGQTGPLATTAGHDINYLAITGALHAIGRSGEPPVPPLNLVADYAGGAMFLLSGLLAALHERQQSGRGQVIDAAMIDGVPAMMGFIQNLYRQDQWLPERQSNMLDGGAPYYRCYETADHKYIAVGAIEAPFFAQLLKLAELPEADIARQNDRAEWPEMHQRYEQHFKLKTRDEWMQIFVGSDACVSPVLSFEEAPSHEHNQQRQVFKNTEFEAMPAPRFDRTPAVSPGTPATAGGDTEELLSDLGYDAAQLAKLRESGVVT